MNFTLNKKNKTHEKINRKIFDFPENSNFLLKNDKYILSLTSCKDLQKNRHCYVSFLNDRKCFVFSFRIYTDGTSYNHEITQMYHIQYDTSGNIIDTKKSTNLFRLKVISHNITISYLDNKYYGIGGTSQPSYNCKNVSGMYGKYCNGLYLLQSSNFTEWSEPKLIIHRDWGLKSSCCCFDSQPSFFYNKTTRLYYLYVRHNPGTQIRKLQVFTTSDINTWTNNPQAVNINENIYVYTAYIFMMKGKFYGLCRYYTDISKWMKMYNNICLIESDDGIYFKIINKQFIGNYNFFKYGEAVQNSIHYKEDEPYVYFQNQAGTITEHKLL